MKNKTVKPHSVCVVDVTTERQWDREKKRERTRRAYVDRQAEQSYEWRPAGVRVWPRYRAARQWRARRKDSRCDTCAPARTGHRGPGPIAGRRAGSRRRQSAPSGARAGDATASGHCRAARPSGERSAGGAGRRCRVLCAGRSAAVDRPRRSGAHQYPTRGHVRPHPSCPQPFLFPHSSHCPCVHAHASSPGRLPRATPGQKGAGIDIYIFIKIRRARNRLPATYARRLYDHRITLRTTLRHYIIIIPPPPPPPPRSIKYGYIILLH